MKTFLKCCLLVAVIFSTSALHAQDTGSETHDGLFLKFLLGYGYVSTVEKDAYGSDMKIYGWGGLFTFQLGAAPINNLIIFGEITGVSVSDPKIDWPGYASGTMEDTTLSISDVGFGISYYFMPVNIYISTALSFPKATIEIDDSKGSTDRGIGIDLALGKEWWVSDNWGLGIALMYNIFKTKDEGNNFIGWYAGLCFSATFN